MYNIYWISVHWYCNLSPDVLENCQWGVSKLYICICFLRRFVEGCGEGARFFISPFVINTLIDFKSVPQIGYFILINKPHSILFLLLMLYIIVGPSITKAHWVNPCIIFGGFLEIDI